MLKFVATICLISGFMIFVGGCSLNLKPEFTQIEKQNYAEEYIRNNISEISPSDPVLGGTWYVVEIEFMDDETVNITYEDGHIQKIITANYHISEDKSIDLEVLSETDV